MDVEPTRVTVKPITHRMDRYKNNLIYVQGSIVMDDKCPNIETNIPESESPVA